MNYSDFAALRPLRIAPANPARPVLSKTMVVNLGTSGGGALSDLAITGGAEAIC